MESTNRVSIAATDELMEKMNDLPINMTVSDVADFLGICSTTAYKLVNQKDFPKLQMPGIKRVVIPKTKFLDWYLHIQD